MSSRNEFDDRFRHGSDELYFLQHVDEDARSLKVEVLGLGLSQVFLHQYPKDVRFITTILEKKTTGFLAAVTAAGKRVVLAWAESGHGLDCHGDALSASPYVLSNAKWAHRAIKLAKVLGIDFASPFDKTDTRAVPRGSFQAAHVEVKLATHAVLLLFRLAKCPDRAITASNLRRLRHMNWKDGNRLHFEVYVSRKNCGRCGTFLAKLQHLTGMQFDIRWGTRVVPIQYHQQRLLDAAQLGLVQHREPIELQTYEQDGVVHYITPETAVADESGQKDASDKPPPISVPRRISPHHLSDVDKPLPATPVTEAPDWNMASTDDQVRQDDSAVSQLDGEPPFPHRSPRPYSLCLR